MKIKSRDVIVDESIVNIKQPAVRFIIKKKHESPTEH